MQRRNMFIVAASAVLMTAAPLLAGEGSCCLSDGSCSQILSQFECEAVGGSHTFDTCDISPCVGLCCLPTHCLFPVGTSDCQHMGGTLIDDCVDCTDRAHPGWNHVSTEITLTKNEPTYWSALSGQPKGVAPFTVLDPGAVPGRPANDGTTDRVLRGYIVAWAVDANNQEIRWNHLKGDATVVHFDNPSAWEYNAWAFQSLADVAHGEQTGIDPGVLNLDGNEYSMGFDQLVLDFYASGSQPFVTGPEAGNCSPTIDTHLTLHPIDLDLRQEDNGPVTTKAKIDVWNENEIKFNGLERCITCWDKTFLSQYADFGIPNNFVYQSLQTNKGKARINGIRSDNCDLDYEFDPDVPFGDDPRDIVSQDASLLGVSAKRMGFWVCDGEESALGTRTASGRNLFGMGAEAATIRYDVLDATPEATGRVARDLARAGQRLQPGADAGTNEGVAATQDRVSATEKGSVLIFSCVEIRWDRHGNLRQDTFVDIANDFGDDVTVQMYFINGDAPIPAGVPLPAMPIGLLCN